MDSIITDEIKDFFVGTLNMAVNNLTERCLTAGKDVSDIHFPSIVTRHGQLEIGCGTDNAVSYVQKFFSSMRYPKQIKVDKTEKATPAHTFTVTAPIPDTGVEPT